MIARRCSQTHRHPSKLHIDQEDEPKAESRCVQVRREHRGAERGGHVCRHPGCVRPSCDHGRVSQGAAHRVRAVGGHGAVVPPSGASPHRWAGAAQSHGDGHSCHLQPGRRLCARFRLPFLRPFPKRAPHPQDRRTGAQALLLTPPVCSVRCFLSVEHRERGISRNVSFVYTDPCTPTNPAVAHRRSSCTAPRTR
jgi:hypothetical protein